MRQSHVDRRAKRYAARQYVSDTHDHKPDAAMRKLKPAEPEPASVAPKPIDSNQTS